MGSKLQAHRAAALYAVEELHKLGELNHLFFPVPSVDSDDEEMQREKMDPLAGTERRHWLCRNNVSESTYHIYVVYNSLLLCLLILHLSAMNAYQHCS